MTLHFSGLGTLATVAVVGSAVFGCSKEQPPAPPAVATPKKVEAPAEPAVTYPPLPTVPTFAGLRVPKDNPLTPAKVALGHQLFFDKRLSVDGSVSCYSCHQNENGTAGHDPIGVGAKGVKLTRHAPMIWNVGFLPRLYWDGRAETLEDQMTAAWSGANMGVGKENLRAKAKEIGAIPGYKKEFDEAFPGDGATPETIAQAVSSYERTLYCADTAFDKFNAGDQSALDADQKAGWGLFTGKAGCFNCHTPPMFSDAYNTDAGSYHNTGMGIEGVKEADVDVGRMKVTGNESDWAAFKTPSLRNITKIAPYFHNGSKAKLEDAVHFMAGGGFKNKNRDARLVDRKLTPDDFKHLIAFLGALECKGTLEEPKLP